MKKIIVLSCILIVIFSSTTYAFFPFWPSTEWKIESLLNNNKEAKENLREKQALQQIKQKKKLKKQEMQFLFKMQMQLGPQVIEGNPNNFYIKFDEKIINNQKIDNILNNTFENKKLVKLERNKVPLATLEGYEQVPYIKARLTPEIELDISEDRKKELEDKTIKLKKIQKVQSYMHRLENKEEIASVYGEYYINSFGDLFSKELWNEIYKTKYSYFQTFERAINFEEESNKDEPPKVQKIIQEMKKDQTNLPELKYQNEEIKQNDELNNETKIKVENDENNNIPDNINQKLKQNPQTTSQLIEKYKKQKRLQTKETYLSILYSNYAYNYNITLKKGDKWVDRKNKFRSEGQRKIINNAERLIQEVGNRNRGQSYNQKGYRETHQALLQLKSKLLAEIQKAMIDRNRLLYLYALNNMNDNNKEKLKQIFQTAN